jgi:hypothetical protein
MAIKFTNIFHYKALQNLTKFWIFCYKIYNLATSIWVRPRYVGFIGQKGQKLLGMNFRGRVVDLLK